MQCKNKNCCKKRYGQALPLEVILGLCSVAFSGCFLYYLIYPIGETLVTHITHMRNMRKKEIFTIQRLKIFCFFAAGAAL